jgi:hypothetical protein
LNTDQPARPFGKRIAYLLNFKSTGFLFEQQSTGATAQRADCLPANDFFGNISVDFLKQVEISGKQPYFKPNFSEQKNLSSYKSPSNINLITSLLVYFLMR